MIYEKILKCGHFKIAEEYKAEHAEFVNAIVELQRQVDELTAKQNRNKVIIATMEADLARKNDIIQRMKDILLGGNNGT